MLRTIYHLYSAFMDVTKAQNYGCLAEVLKVVQMLWKQLNEPLFNERMRQCWRAKTLAS